VIEEIASFAATTVVPIALVIFAAVASQTYLLSRRWNALLAVLITLISTFIVVGVGYTALLSLFAEPLGLAKGSDKMAFALWGMAFLYIILPLVAIGSATAATFAWKWFPPR
jgi:hypothetical protein